MKTFLLILITFVFYSFVKQNQKVVSIQKAYKISHIYNKRVSGAPGGKTGAPEEGKCTDCHSGTAIQNSSINQLELFEEGSQNPSTFYKAGFTYDVFLTINNTAARKGFQTTARILTNNTTAGTLIGVQNSTAFLSFSAKEFINHIQSSTILGLPFHFKWIAPNDNVGEIKFYVASNVTNNNGNNSGDVIHLSSHGINFEASEPFADFTVSTSEICKNQAVQFTSTSKGLPENYFWEFEGGNPSTSTDINPTISFPEFGNFNVKLTVSNAIGSNETIKEQFISVGSCANLKSIKNDTQNYFPNPFFKEIHFDLKDIKDFDELLIFDSKGKLEQKLNLNSDNINLNLEKLAQGTHTFKLKKGNIEKNEKIIVL